MTLRDCFRGILRSGLVVTAAGLLVTMGLYATLRTGDLLAILPGLSAWLGESAAGALDAAGIAWLALGLALVLAEAAVQRRLRLWSEMARDARRISEVDDHQRVSESRDEPVIHVARALNHLVDRLKQSELYRQRETERADALQRAAKARRDTLASMNHEIRTPLTAMLGFAENMAEADLSPHARFEAVQLIRRNGDRLMQIIKELLETSSVEMGHSEIEAGGGGSRFEEREGEAGPFSIATDRGPAGAAPSGPAAPKGHAPESSTAPPAPDKPPTAASAPASKPTLKLSGRVLVAEDCPDNARIVAAMLERAGLSVQTATNGQIACNLALKHHREGRPFDLLLMDLNMPVLDGCDATRLLRAEGYQGPIVALTASTDNCDRGRCVRAGCNAFAGKPIERDALLRTIAAFIPQGAAVTAPS